MTDQTNTSEAPIQNEAPVQTETLAETATQDAPLSFLSEELRGEKGLMKFKDVDSLAKSYLHAQSMLGKSFRLPSEDASEEEMASFKERLGEVDTVLFKDDPELMNKLGRPSTAEEYRFDLPEGMDENENLVESLNEFRKEFHDLGLTQEQAAKLVSKRVEEAKANDAAMMAQREEAVSKLKDAWGQEFDQQLSNASKTLKALESEYPAEVAELKGAVGNNAALLKLAAVAAKVFSEQQAPELRGAKFSTTPEQAMMEANRLMTDRAFMDAYVDPTHKEHNAAKAKLAKLNDAMGR